MSVLAVFTLFMICGSVLSDEGKILSRYRLCYQYQINDQNKNTNRRFRQVCHKILTDRPRKHLYKSEATSVSQEETTAEKKHQKKLNSSLVVPCNTDDIVCLSKSTETFLEQTHKGIPNYNILAIDPLVIPSLDVPFETEGLTYKYTNINVNGLKNQKISDFKMDTVAKSVVLTTKADLNIVGDVAVELKKLSKNFAGRYTYHASVLGTATYNYELKTDDKGVEHFDVGPETITCKVVNTPTVELNQELGQTLSNDPDAKAFTEEKKAALREKAFCEIVKKAYTSVVHNIRSAAKLLPASSFFKNLHEIENNKSAA